jgi:predicted unusual protein kinase regulating ubiquinone biosynthesis (AarF/ABC1/UbiB family)
MLERDMLEEMDFEREATMQRRGAAVLARHDGIVVPSVAEEYSDKDHITMDLVPSERIEDLAANPEYLKNVMILVLQGRRSGFLHGDMHGGNIKAVANDPLGRLVAFDWGKSLELPSGFEKNVVNLVVAVMRKNPSAMAKAFREVQNADDSQTELGDLELAAQDAIEEIIHSSSARKQERQQKMGKAERKLQETADIITNFSALVAKRHQAGLDVRYITYMKSMTSLATIVKAELAKPEYGNKRFRNVTLLKSAAAAVREVYRKK